jgi:serine/threonine protein kinase
MENDQKDSKVCPQCGGKLVQEGSLEQCLGCLLQLGLLENRAEPNAERDQIQQEYGGIPEQVAAPKLENYIICSKLGEGGFGVVYLAEQLKPIRRQVALKVIKLGMDTRRTIARFEKERQALAVLEHPNIAKVFEAGATERGHPYFAMELVRGRRINEFCKQEKVNLQGRLELFIQVCHAVSHAHQKGILHRDLKPSNVLVSEQGGAFRPIIIDFGIAKATTDDVLANDSVYTSLHEFLGTPAYVSPEQATGKQVDVRTDVYSLGALLYELLTGVPPLECKRRGVALEETLRQIRAEPPVPPSKRLRMGPHPGIDVEVNSSGERTIGQVDRQLDWIIMRALEKAPARRYQSVEALAEDLQSYLHGTPITARPTMHGTIREVALRRPVLAASLAVVILSGLVALFIAGLHELEVVRSKNEAKSVPVPSGMISWWQGEGNSTDAVNGISGFMSNIVNFVPGKVGRALSFNGSNSIIEVPDAPELRLTNEITIEFWLQRQRIDGSEDVLEKGGDWTGSELNYEVGVHTAQFNYMLQFLFKGGFRGGGSIPDTNWHHCAVTARNGDTDPSLYVDGVQVPVVFRGGNATVNLFPSTKPLHIGGQYDPTSFKYYSQLNIDELSLYNRILTSTEIRQIHAAGSAGKRRPKTPQTK